MVELIIRDSLIKFYANGFFAIILIVFFLSSTVVHGLRIHRWILMRKIKINMICSKCNKKCFAIRDSSGKAISDCCLSDITSEG